MQIVPQAHTRNFVLFPGMRFLPCEGFGKAAAANSIREENLFFSVTAQILLLEIKNRHPDIAPAIQDERVGTRGIKMIDAVNKNVLVEDVEIGTIVEFDSVTGETEMTTGFKRLDFTPHSDQMRSLAQIPAGSNEVAEPRHRSKAAHAQPAAKGGYRRVQQTLPFVGCNCDRATFAAGPRGQWMRGRLRAPDNS